jgi:hypothetical protein
MKAASMISSFSRGIDSYDDDDDMVMMIMMVTANSSRLLH